MTPYLAAMEKSVSPGRAVYTVSGIRIIRACPTAIPISSLIPLSKINCDTAIPYLRATENSVSPAATMCISIKIPAFFILFKAYEEKRVSDT